jgi:hypothetical protein
MTLLTFERVAGFIIITAFTCSLTTGLILTFATSSGISAGAIPFTIAGCILMCIIILTVTLKCLEYCGIA